MTVKVAIIAPVPLLTKFASLSDNYHLLLSYLFERPGYVDFYRECGCNGDFLLLDNSAHELGHGEGFDQLAKKIESVSPHEVVVPDRLFFGDDTLENAEEFIPQFREHFGHDIKLMGVPQGRTISEWTDCLNGLIDMGVDSIGISKDYEVWDGGLYNLAMTVDYSVGQNVVHGVPQTTPMPIHMLGWGRDLRQIQGFTPFNDQSTHAKIRGVDSAKPLVYAQAGINLSEAIKSNHGIIPRYPKRPVDFYACLEIDEEIALDNIGLMRSWATGHSY